MRTETVLTAGLVVLALVAVALSVAPQVRATTGRLWFATLARLVLAGYLGVAGLLKLPHPAESVRAVRAYRILPESVVPTVGYVLPLLEVAIAVLLLLGLGTRVASLLTAVLMTAFIIGIASVSARGINIDCGCFGGGGDVAAGETRYTQEIIRDVCLLLLAMLLTWRPSSRLSLDPSSRHHVDLDAFDANAPDAHQLDTDHDGTTLDPASGSDVHPSSSHAGADSGRRTSTQENQS